MDWSSHWAGCAENHERHPRPSRPRSATASRSPTFLSRAPQAATADERACRISSGRARREGRSRAHERAANDAAGRARGVESAAVERTPRRGPRALTRVAPRRRTAVAVPCVRGDAAREACDTDGQQQRSVKGRRWRGRRGGLRGDCRGRRSASGDGERDRRRRAAEDNLPLARRHAARGHRHVDAVPIACLPPQGAQQSLRALRARAERTAIAPSVGRAAAVLRRRLVHCGVG